MLMCPIAVNTPKEIMAKNQLLLPLDYQVFACPIDRRLRLCSREGTQHLFVVVRRRCLAFWGSAVPLLAAVLCKCVRCARRAGRRARARCRRCPVAVAAAAAVCALRLSLRWACAPWGVRARWVQGLRAGCPVGGGVGPCRRRGRGVALPGWRCASVPPVPVLEMSSLLPLVLGAVAADVSPRRLVHAHGVAGGVRGTAARGAVAVLAWRWR